MLDTATIQRFEIALSVGFSALKDLALNMASEGLSQAAICHAFDLYGRYLHEAGRDDDAGFIWVSIESIVGWRNRSDCWFDHYLTKEAFDDYRRSIDAPLRPLFHSDSELYNHDT